MRTRASVLSLLAALLASILIPVATQSATAGGLPPNSGQSAPLLVEHRSALEVARAIAQRVPTAGKITKFTTANDPNNLLGRPNGYSSAASIKDSRTNTTDLGVGMGATVEVFQTAAQAANRLRYMDALQQGLSFYNDYNYRIGNVLLRVTGDLTPSQAKQYKRAFTAVVGQAS